MKLNFQYCGTLKGLMVHLTCIELGKTEMGRRPCCSKEGLNRGAWTVSEDAILTAYIQEHGEGNWRNLPGRAGKMFTLYVYIYCHAIYILVF